MTVTHPFESEPRCILNTKTEFKRINKIIFLDTYPKTVSKTITRVIETSAKLFFSFKTENICIFEIPQKARTWEEREEIFKV